MADGITIRAESLQFDGGAFSEAMNTTLEQLFHDAARAFLIAATRRTPIRTGFLRGAYGRLEDVVGAFEASASKSQPRGLAKPRKGERLGKDLASTASRVARLRAKQRQLLRAIGKLQKRESLRRERFNDRLLRLRDKIREQKGDKAEIPEAQLKRLLTGFRSTALRDRNAARSLLKLATEGERKLQETVAAFKKKLDGDLRANVSDAIRNLSLRDKIIQQKRNELFQKSLRDLKKKLFGAKSKNPRFSRNNKAPRNVPQRTEPTMGQREFDRAVENLRREHAIPTKAQREIRKRQTDVISSLLNDEQKKRLQTLTTRLRTKREEALHQAKLNNDTAAINAAEERLTTASLGRGVKRIAKKILRPEVEDSHLLAALQRRAERSRKLGDFEVERLRQELNETEGLLLPVARTNTGRIVGQNAPGRFNLGHGERVKKLFNGRDNEGKILNQRREFYYPSKGSPETKVLKTPRTGRRFATPANAIILKFSDPPKPGVDLLRSLAGFVKSAGGQVQSDVQRYIGETRSMNTRYEFHFAIDISYLAINDAKQAWQSWQAGINAFSYVINAKGPGRLPKLSSFTYKITRRLEPGGTRTISGRK